ncbi:hypothetical protein ACHHYP_09833 [Achlya hypogyna]|uniref:Uncharacterized protein n=1 Tax=Achlya hypogyna TaxID=1202772 RepID=A0A1V9YMC5_ACHHY|nr:hypothetical protein ACHHYP_09833 [Achlya hypogyna]
MPTIKARAESMTSDDTSTASSSPSSPRCPAYVYYHDMPKAVKPAKTCLYRTGKCDLPRHVKANGALHKMCTYHRTKANENQRRLDQKKKDAGFHRRERISQYKVKGVLQPKSLGKPVLPPLGAITDDYMPDVMIPFLLDNYSDVVLEEVLLV